MSIKKVIDVCPFMGLTWEDENEKLHYKGEGLFLSENQRIDSYFKKFHGQPFKRERAIELAQFAIDNLSIPKGWRPNQR